MNLISANSRLFTQADLRLSTLMRECTAIKYTLTDYEFSIVICKNNNYQNKRKEPQVQKEKLWTVPHLLESPKSKQLQTPSLEIYFSIDSGAIQLL